jgi:hypothetical protein
MQFTINNQLSLKKYNIKKYNTIFGILMFPLKQHFISEIIEI